MAKFSTNTENQNTNQKKERLNMQVRFGKTPNQDKVWLFKEKRKAKF